MTNRTSLHPAAAALAAAVVTAALFTAVIWRQHAVKAWPFDHAASGESAALRGGSMADDHGGFGISDRVPVDDEGYLLEHVGVRTEPVRRETLRSEVRSVATVVPDESSISHVHTRVAGWVEQLDVNTTGQVVRAGQPLLRIFSQELFSSQTEYLAARRHAASGIATAVVAGGRTRLEVLGMSAAEIETIERHGEPMRLVTVVAPRSGIVVNRGVTVGTSVDTSTTLLTIADLSRVWVLAEVPEAGMTAVRVGTPARVEFPASGIPPVTARVDFVYPTLTERTRTLRVRFAVRNAHGALKPGLYGTAIFETRGEPVLTVPRDAIVDTGVQQHVFVSRGGTFEPRLVAVGARMADRVEVRSGVQEGEHVVSSGVFLIDSESRLRAAGGTAGHQHGSTAGTPAGDAAGTPAARRRAAPAGTHERHDVGAPPGNEGKRRANDAAVRAPDPHQSHRGATAPAAPDPHAGHETHSTGHASDPHTGHREEWP